MADFAYNVAKKLDLNWTSNTIKALLLKATSTVDKDHDTVAAVLSGNNESDATGYVRKTLASKTVTVDDTNDRVDLGAASIVWTALGGATNNTLDRLIVYKEVTNDADSIPLVSFDVTKTTDGTDFTWEFSSGIVLRAT